MVDHNLASQAPSLPSITPLPSYATAGPPPPPYRDQHRLPSGRQIHFVQFDGTTDCGLETRTNERRLSLKQIAIFAAVMLIAAFAAITAALLGTKHVAGDLHH